MIQWKERLYAFLIRRFVGPWLTEESWRRLYQSIDVSLQDGIFVLRNVSLATSRLTTLLQQPVRIRKATVEKLEIHLNLQEHVQEEAPDQEASSLAWRAWKLGTALTPGAVSVVVQIKVEGICIEVEPDNEFIRHVSKPIGHVEADASTSKGVFASYMEAVLASLKLSVQVQDLEVKLYSTHDETSSRDWIALRIQSLSYHDIDQTGNTNASQRDYETIMQKALDIQRISIVVGSEKAQEKNFSTMVALLEGNSRFRLRVVEYRTGDASRQNLIQHDTEVILGQKFNVFVDENTVLAIQQITRNYRTAFERATLVMNDNQELEVTASGLIVRPEPTEDDSQQIEEDMQTLDTIMRQYHEARRLAERQQMRGGILIPNKEDSKNMTYDAFFDANDQSIYRYSTMMSHALGNTTEESGADFVHLKARLFLKSGSCKLAFGTSKLEYMLATFSDLNANATFSKTSSTIVVTLLHLGVDDAYSVSGANARMRTEISRVLHFITSEEFNDGVTLDQGELLLTPPCISIEMQVTKKPDKSQVAINMEPMQLSCHPSTILNLSLFTRRVSSLDGRVDLSEQTTQEDPGAVETELSILLSCPTMDILLPLSLEGNLDVLFERCGYVGDGTLSAPLSASFGVHVDSLYVNYDKDNKTSVECSCNHVVGYVMAPTRKRLRTTQYQVVDLFCLSGNSQSLSLLYQVDKTAAKAEANHAVEAFPLAPTVASFKARQEDEDEENQIDRVLLSKMGNLGLAAKRELRGKDPQRQMLQNCQKCQTSVVLRIPQVSFDASVDECTALIKEFRVLKLFESGDTEATSKESSSSANTAISFECGRVSLGIHHGRSSRGRQKEMDATFVLKVRRLRMHLVSSTLGLIHCRFATQEIDFLEAGNLASETPVKDDRSSEARSTAIFQRLKCTDSSVKPILYRSHLFKPLSRESPSVLVDVLFNNENSLEAEVTLPQSLHCTLYDITYRHSDESTWMDDIRSMIDRLLSSNDADRCLAGEKSEPRESLTRVFVAIADCNIDYSTPRRFKNRARMLLRLGDMRCSSNVVLPAPSIQSYNASIADLSLCLCNDRRPYNFENSMLIDSDMLFIESDSRHKFNDATDALKDMNYRTMVLLDTMDAIVAVANIAQSKKSIPKIYASLTLGELSLFASKDSFWLLVQALGEAVGEATAVSDTQIKALKERADSQEDDEETFFDSVADAEDDELSAKQPAYVDALDTLKKQSALRPAIGTKSSRSQKHQFLLDGYDWTTIDQAESSTRDLADDEEQSARWYPTKALADPETQSQVAVVAGPGVSLSEEASKPLVHPVRIIPHHFPLRPDNDPLADGDMGAAKYAGTSTSPRVSSRVLVHDMKLKLRLFDGYDWPEMLSSEALNKERNDSFLIDSPDPTEALDSAIEEKTPETQQSKLMADLLGDSTESPGTFKDVPLPEEKGARLMRMAKYRRLAKRTGTYFQISASGICLRNDSFEVASSHRLASCLTLKAQDFFIADTISGNKPVKMVGEWFSEDEHPRDSRDGLLMMKMVTWAPQRKITDENEIANDECEVVVKVLPLRCLLDQRAIRFATTFFRPDNPKDISLPKGLHAIPPPRVRLFRFKPFRLKVNYKPEKVNHQALRDGQIVELINFSPLHDMVLTLQQVEVADKIGFGDVVSVLTKNWIGDICSTQIIKFLTNAQPFEPITSISGGVVDMVVLPWEAIQNGDSLQRSLCSGAKSFAKAVAYEALTISSGLAEFMATKTAVGSASYPLLPSRPEGTPRGMRDTGQHALESIARGFQEANYKVIIIPYREYQRSGTTGALKSVLKGIPVALSAPASGAAEALSFALLGARNQLRPDIRKEEEVNQRGLRLDT